MVTTHRQFESTAERHAFDGGDGGFRHAFEKRVEGPERRASTHVRTPEFTDVGTSAECGI